MSITLTNAASLSLNGSTIESDANSAAVYMEVPFPDTVRLVFAYGTTAGQTFTQGSNLGQVSVSISLVTGKWISTNGLSGTLGGGALTTFKSTITGWRNSAETFAVNNSVIVGTTVAWT